MVDRFGGHWLALAAAELTLSPALNTNFRWHNCNSLSLTDI
jgi:hypothetical protein